MTVVLAIGLLCAWSLALINFLLLLKSHRKINSVMKYFEPTPTLPSLTIAPDFTAQNIDGETVSLETTVKTPTLFLFFHPNCLPCKDAITLLVGSYSKVKTAGMEVVLVTDSDKAEVKPVMLELQVTMPVLLVDPMNRKFIENYNPGGAFPYFCFVDASKIVISSGFIGSQQWYEIQEMWKVN